MASEPSAHYSSGEVRYPDAAALKADLVPYLSQGVLWARGTDLPPPLREFPFKLLLPDGTSFTLRGQIVSRVGENALIRLSSWTPAHFAAAEAAARAAAPPPPQPLTPVPPPPSAPRAIATPALESPRPELGPPPPLRRPERPSPDMRSLTPPWVPSVPPGVIDKRSLTPLVIPSTPPPVRPTPTPSRSEAGQLRNPKDVRAMARQPLRPDALVDHLPDDAALVDVIRWLGLRRASGTLTLLSGERRLEIALRLGRIVVPEKEPESAFDAATWPSADFVFEPCDENRLPATRRAWSTWIYVVGVVRRQLADLSLGELQAALPQKRAPRLLQRGRDLIASMELPVAEQRFAEQRLQRGDTLTAVLRASNLSELAAVRLLVLLHLVDFLEWDEPGAPLPAEDEWTGVRAELQRRSSGSHFKALGIHYSATPAQIQAAYRAVAAEYGAKASVGGPAGELAARMVALAEGAWAVLGDPPARRRYRREIMPVPPPAAARLLYVQAKAAEGRREIAEAQEILEEAIDLDPSVDEYREALKSLVG